MVYELLNCGIMGPSSTPNPLQGSIMTTRRQFLKHSALAGAAVTAGISTVSAASAVHAGGSGKIKVGLIGCGGRGRGAVNQALQTGKDVEIVAVGDYFKSRAVSTRTLFMRELPEDQVRIPEENVFDGFQNHLGVIGADVDVVLIAGAAKFHPLQALAAVKAGKHVFVEKPCAIDSAGIHMLEKAVALAQQKSLSFDAGFQSRFRPAGIALVEQIHNGAIGEVRAAQCNFLRSPYGVRGSFEGMTELEFQIFNQYVFSWLSGDDFTQSLVHNVDRISWVLGKYPTAAYGMGGRAAAFGRQYGNVFDHHSAVFYYGNDNCRVFAACRTQNGCFNEYNDIIFGAKGMTDWNSAVIRGETNWRFTGERVDQGSQMQRQQTALFDAVRKGERVDGGDYAVKSSLMAILGQIACYTGHMITWDDIYNSQFEFTPTVAECIAGTASPVPPGPDGTYPVPVPGSNPWW